MILSSLLTRVVVGRQVNVRWLRANVPIHPRFPCPCPVCVHFHACDNVCIRVPVHAHYRVRVHGCVHVQHGNGHEAWKWACRRWRMPCSRIWTYSIDIDSQHGYGQGHPAWPHHTVRTWTWTCSMDTDKATAMPANCWNSFYTFCGKVSFWN
jgi:hypothetical protein